MTKAPISYYLCGSLLASFQYIHVCCTLGSPKLDTALLKSLSSAEERGRITFLDVLAMRFLTQSRVLLAIFAIRKHGWFTFSLASIGTPSFFPAF